MRHYNVIAETDTENSEIISDAMFAAGALGVAIYDKNDLLEIIRNQAGWDYIDDSLLEADDTVHVIGYFDEAEGFAEAFETLKADIAGMDVRCGKIGCELAEDVDWLTEWKKNYTVIDAGKYRVVPNWLKEEAGQEKTNIIIDPGMAFGTGKHETTRLCLELMTDIGFDSGNVMDAGCGSGILGIGALKSGAGHCIFFDIDPVALDAVKINLAENNIADKFDIAAGYPEGMFDVIIANITADILIGYAEVFKNNLKANGDLILSGIIEPRLDDVVAAYQKAGFLLADKRLDGEWYGLRWK